MDFKKSFKKIGKNLLIGISGAIGGIIICVFYLIKIWLPHNADKIGLAIIALLPVLIILFSIMGSILGGFLGIIIYQLVRYLRK